jgi:hypothetical protein
MDNAFFDKTNDEVLIIVKKTEKMEKFAFSVEICSSVAKGKNRQRNE